MATIKVVLRKKQNKDSTYPLALRITKNRKTSFIHLGYHLLEKDWDELQQRVRKSHPNSTRLNNFILTKIAEASDKSLDLETQKNAVSSKAIKQTIKPQAGLTFFAQANLYLERLKETGKYNRWSADKPSINHFKEFLKGEDIAFSDITVNLLNRFQADLKIKRKISERTIVNHLVVIRSVFSQAIGDKVVDKKYYPFGKEGITIKFPETTKVGITKESVEQLEKVELLDPAHNHARNLWLFSYYFAGMRVSDVLRLRWTDFQDMRLHYVMGKNNKAGSVKALQPAIDILEQYKEDKRSADDLIFPDLKILANFDDDFEVQRKINIAVCRCNKMLRLYVAPKAKIEGKLTMHISRHTFATLAGDKIPIQMLQKLYRHSEITTTIGYQANFIHKDADDALESVIGK